MAKFHKGFSGNPGGRPRMPKEVRLTCRRISLKALAKLDRYLDRKDADIRMVYHIAKLTTAYAFGTPVNAVLASDADGSNGITVEIVEFNYDEEDSTPPAAPPGGNVVALKGGRS